MGALSGFGRVGDAIGLCMTTGRCCGGGRCTTTGRCCGGGLWITTGRCCGAGLVDDTVRCGCGAGFVIGFGAGFGFDKESFAFWSSVMVRSVGGIYPLLAPRPDVNSDTEVVVVAVRVLRGAASGLPALGRR